MGLVCDLIQSLWPREKFNMIGRRRCEAPLSFTNARHSIWHYCKGFFVTSLFEIQQLSLPGRVILWTLGRRTGNISCRKNGDLLGSCEESEALKLSMPFIFTVLASLPLGSNARFFLKKPKKLWQWTTPRRKIIVSKMQWVWNTHEVNMKDKSHQVTNPLLLHYSTMFNVDEPGAAMPVLKLLFHEIP